MVAGIWKTGNGKNAPDSSPTWTHSATGSGLSPLRPRGAAHRHHSLLICYPIPSEYRCRVGVPLADSGAHEKTWSHNFSRG